MVIEFHLNLNSQVVRHRKITYSVLFRFHDGFTEADMLDGWKQVQGGSADLSALEIEATERSILEFYQSYWRNLQNTCADRRVIAGGQHYCMHELGVGIGFNGAAFEVQWLDRAREPVLCNLSAQGDIPAWLRSELPDSATISEAPIRAEMPTTIYPARSGGFPPASFSTVGKSLEYVSALQGQRPACGICSCPASSYDMHYPDTVKSQ